MLLPPTSRADPFAHSCRRLSRRPADLRRARLPHRREDVDPVGECSAQLPLVALDVVWRTGAVGVGLAPAAGARIGGGNQHEPTGKAALAAGAGDRDLT